MVDKLVYAIRLKDPLPCTQHEEGKTSLVYGDWLLYCDYRVPFVTTKANSAIHFDSFEAAEECLQRNELNGEIWCREKGQVKDEDWHQCTSVIK
ncbi:MAG TPA: hypothetical protein VK184_19500 [Nostocaceae cyanobacterium]|nr:hypothetical protein [Nostocaceae cyanobacterium]